jgi:hypothetical protein
MRSTPVLRNLSGSSPSASTPLVYASYSETRTELDGAGEVNATGVRAGVTVAPRLELRLSF